MTKLCDRDFLKNLARNKRYQLAPVRVVRGELWEVSHEFKDVEVELMLQGQGDGEERPFAWVYKARWMEMAKADSNGNWFLMNGSSIRTPIITWAQERGYRIRLSASDIVDFSTVGECQ